jgi:hypothetical protein
MDSTQQTAGQKSLSPKAAPKPAVQTPPVRRKS